MFRVVLPSGLSLTSEHDIVPYRENLKYEKQIVLPTPTHADLFGVPLEELMGYDGEKGGIPRVVKDCIQYLRDTGNAFTTNCCAGRVDTDRILVRSPGRRPLPTIS